MEAQQKQTRTFRPASFRRRLLASILDSLILAPISILILYFWIGSEGLEASMNSTSMLSTSLEEAIINYILPAVVSIIFWIKLAGTPGKLILNCKVVDQNTHTNITIQQAIFRYFGYFVSVIPLCLGFLWVIWDKNKQGFHDKLSNTLVIHEDEESHILNDKALDQFEA